MIILDYGYRLEADKYCFILYKDGGIDKRGNQIKTNPTFYPTVLAAIKRYIVAVERDVIQDKDMSLAEAVATFSAFTESANRLVDTIEFALDNESRGIDGD